MKSTFRLLSAATVAFVATQASAVTYVDVAGSLGAGGMLDLGTITNAELAGNRTLVMEATVSRSEISDGDSWFGVGVNSPAGSPGVIVTNNDVGFLIRTRTDAGAHEQQLFNTFGAANAAGNAPATAGQIGTSATARIVATVSMSAAGIEAGQFAGITYAIDRDNDGTFDNFLAGAFDWTVAQANLDIAANGKAHDYAINVSSNNAEVGAVLLRDDFTVNPPGQPVTTNDVNFNLAQRQAGSTLGVVGWRKLNGAANSQIGNTDSADKVILDNANVLLVAGGGGVQTTRNFNGMLAQGGLSMKFDVAPDVRLGDAPTDDWVSFNFGYNLANVPQTFAINNGAPHFGILFRENGDFQAFENNNVVGQGTFEANELVNSFYEGFEILMTDTIDGNAFDGVGESRFDIFYQGNLIFSHTVGNGGYLDNFIAIQSSGIGYVDNLVIRNMTIPEPASMSLLLIGGAALLRRRRAA